MISKIKIWTIKAWGNEVEIGWTVEIAGAWRILGWVPRFLRLYYHCTFQFLPPVFTLHQGLSPWLLIIPVPTPSLTLAPFRSLQLPDLPCSSSQVGFPLSFSCPVWYPPNNCRECKKRWSLFPMKTKMSVHRQLFLVCLFLHILVAIKCLNL